MHQQDFQKRVHEWIEECFTSEIVENPEERALRFLEESIELVQACGLNPEQVMTVVAHVYNREVGDVHQEVGGTLVTLAALCTNLGIDMDTEEERELKRIWEKIDKIREKQNAKTNLGITGRSEEERRSARAHDIAEALRGTSDVDATKYHDEMDGDPELRLMVHNLVFRR